MAEYHLTAPLTETDVTKLKIGDTVYLSGDVFTCRSRLHKYIFDEGHSLPFETKERNVLIHNGPIVIKDGDKWRLVSFMPTSSIRFEKWGAKSVENWGLKMIIGKTTMGKSTCEMMKKKKCVHVSPRSVSPNLWIDSIRVDGVYLFDELGSIEAAWHFHLEDLGPFVVDIDSNGNNLFDNMDKEIECRKREAFKKLGIASDFEYTKLY